MGTFLTQPKLFAILWPFYIDYWPNFMISGQYLAILKLFWKLSVYLSFISKTLSHENAIKSAYFLVARIEESIEIEKRYFGEIDQNQNRKSLVSKNRNRNILESTQLYYLLSKLRFFSCQLNVFLFCFYLRKPSA